ncbi:hypothetical protein KC355_g7454 [Hortaea werneckii]|nr:hypothetical protein KC355_g7454 [Hortaea werneckii]
MSALYNSALRQSKSIRADLETFSSPSPPNATALQGQITTSLTSFSRTLDDYQKNIDVELVPEKAEKGKERITKFREELLDQTPENPYADSAISSGAGRGQNVNPLFRTNNPNFHPGANGPNAYSAYQSPYGLGADEARENHALREQSFFSSANTTLDEYLERGRTVLGDLGDQREMLKGTQKKLYNIGTTLGVSGDTIRMVERRAKEDKFIFWGGVVVFIIFVYLVLRWLR